MKQLLYFICGLFLFTACEKTIQLDLDQSPEVVIIEGLLTDEFAKHYVKISKSVQFEDTGQTPRVENATVEVRDNEGNQWTYVEFAPGFYEAAEPFAGKVGNIYTMEVVIDDKVYTATDQLLSNGTIDSLTIRIDEEERQDDPVYFYEVLMYLTEPPATQDYYLFKFFRDDNPLNDDGETVFYTDDVAVRENVEGFAIPYFFKEGNTARIELYSLTRKAFLYYRDLQENVLNDGGLFSGQPANVSTNIEGGALGYFQTSSKRMMEIEVKE